MQTIYAATMQDLIALVTAYAGQDYKLDASSVSEGALHQPAIIADNGGRAYRLRPNAMADRACYVKSTEAFCVAEEIIASAHGAQRRMQL